MQHYKSSTYQLREEWYGELHRRQERETNFDVFAKVSEPSFQIIWFCPPLARRTYDWQPSVHL